MAADSVRPQAMQAEATASDASSEVAGPADAAPAPVAPGGAGAAVREGGPSPAATAAPAEMADGGTKVAGRAPAPQVAANGVKAGEWDDNANYRDFVKYIGQKQSLGIDAIDVSTRRFVVVTDKQGRGVPNCDVTIKEAQGNRSFALKTSASGRALFFPKAMGFGSSTATFQASCANASTRAVTAELKDTDGVVPLSIASDRAAITAPTIDVVFVLDTTGSMSEEIASVKATLAAVVKNLGQDVKVRVGLVEYKDRGDAIRTRTFALTSNVKDLSARIESIVASGGGDTPEDVNAGLAEAIEKMSWSPDATARLAFLIADAPPHLDYANTPSYSASALSAAKKGIKIFTVSASGMDDLGQAVFRQVAQVTGGTNMFVLRGGAGPQSTGAGDAQSSCGGTHQQFSSGNLDKLILDKIKIEAASLHGNPMRIAGLGTDENAKPCADRIIVVAN